MILETIAEATRKRVAAEKEKCSFAEMKEKATAMNPDTGFPFEQALKKPGMSFICEVKKASPSKGIIAEDFPYLEIAKEYEAAGASAISCLTEPEYFKGDKRYLKKIAETVSIPVLRKDFTVDPYMIYEAKVLGATAVLLICALLPEETLKEYLETAHSLGLSALVEAHDEAEVAQAMVSLGGAEVDAQGLAVADVQIAVGLRRETGVNGQSLEPATLCDVLVDKVQNKVFALGTLLVQRGLPFLGHCLTLLVGRIFVLFPVKNQTYIIRCSPWDCKGFAAEIRRFTAQPPDSAGWRR